MEVSHIEIVEDNRWEETSDDNDECLIDTDVDIVIFPETLMDINHEGHEEQEGTKFKKITTDIEIEVKSRNGIEKNHLEDFHHQINHVPIGVWDKADDQSKRELNLETGVDCKDS